jgi:hypothetical protein
MGHFLIWHAEDKISIHECVDNTLVALKNMGEDQQTFEAKAFWEWWKRKIEYNGEAVSFIIFTDKDAFNVPEDIKIVDVKKLGNLCNQYLFKTPKGSHIITKPENLYVEHDRQKVKKVTNNDNSLEGYFIKETIRLKSKV